MAPDLSRANAGGAGGAGGVGGVGGVGGAGGAAAVDDYRHLSLWWEQIPAPVARRQPLAADLQVDVAIVGAGFTGLWTALSLITADPSLRIAVVERETAGFGASGRNGGWCSALFAASDAKLAREYGRQAALDMRRAMNDTVDEVGRMAVREEIDCGFHKGGTVVAARSTAQAARARSEVGAARALGSTQHDLRWLDRDEASAMLNVPGVLGATFTPHCAALQPAALARGLARSVQRHGVALYEGTTVTGIDEASGGRPAVVRTIGGSVRADVVVRALEGWTATLPGLRRTVAPVYSLMVATRPLSEAFWERAGLADRQTFSDYRHLIIYGQRTADDRLAFGGRGAPYHFGSSVRPSFDRVPTVHAALRETVIDLFPTLGPADFTHAWGGPLAMPRDWFTSVGLDRQRGLAWAGGYVGDGVSTSNLAGRTLADLILGVDSDLVRLPWVGHRSPRWEPEPLRWLGVNAGLWAMQHADSSEERMGHPSRLATRLERLLGS